MSARNTLLIFVENLIVKIMKTYKRTHSSTPAANKHIAKIQKRGGKITKQYTNKIGEILIEYSFENVENSKSKSKFKGAFRIDTPDTVLELEKRLGVKFNLYKRTGSFYGDYNGKKIRLADHPSKFIENKGGDLDFNYNYYTASMMEAIIKGLNRFRNIKKGDYIKHSKEDRVGKCFFQNYNKQKGFVEVLLENGEIKKYDDEMFKLD